MRRTRPVLRVLLLVLALVLLVQTPALRAQAVLELADAMRAGLAANPALRIARDQVRIEHGNVMIAQSAFDATITSSLVGGRYDDLAPGKSTNISDASGVASSRRETINYDVGIEKQFRSGVMLLPAVTVSRLSQPALGGLPVNRAEAGIAAVVPLSRNRLGGVSVSQLKAAQQGEVAADLEHAQVLARTAYEVGVAYWQYAAASERVRVLRSAEARARTLVNEASELVRGDARPAADLIQFRGNLATKRSQRVSAEQTVAESRKQLGLVLGVSATDVLALPPASPLIQSDDSVLAAADSLQAFDADRRGDTWARAHLASVLARRPDVRAVRARRIASTLDVAAAHSATRAQLDLRVSVAYSGLDRGLGLNGFAAPLWRSERGASVTVALQYSLPASNFAARGRAEQVDALTAQAATRERDQLRQVETAIAVAAAGVYRGRAALAESMTAARIAREVVENEKQKFRLGMATQIDVIYAEDALTSALVSEITSRAVFATAVAVLRLESGALASARDDSVRLAEILRDTTDLRSQP